MTFSCLHFITVLCVAWNTLQAVCGLYATARTSFIVCQNKKATRLTTRRVLKIVFSHMRPLQEHEEEDIKEVIIQFYRQAYDYISAWSDFYIRIRHYHESSFVGFAVHVVLKKYQPAIHT